MFFINESLYEQEILYTCIYCV